MIWYEDEVKQLELQNLQYKYPPETIFYGSSSIRMWDTLEVDFKDYNPAKLGFGGSTLAACVWFFNRLIAPLKPKRIVFYAGDNDLGDGRHPEEVYIFFQQLMVRVKQSFGDIPFAFISIKPSIARWPINNQIKYANELIEQHIKSMPGGHYIDIYSRMVDSGGYPVKDYFIADGLHLSPKGYDLWREVVLQYLKS